MGREPCRDSSGLSEGREGQSWAEKSLKNGRILVEFQKLRKPQDAKGTYFPKNSPSALLEWGSGGRWFESSRPDNASLAVTTSCGEAFLWRSRPARRRAGNRAGKSSSNAAVRLWRIMQ